MKIQELIINNFRNIKHEHYTFDTDSNVVLFSGNNKSGKTNRLHAIMWCLTGYDLDNDCHSRLTIPYDLLSGNENFDVLVTIKFDTGLIITRIFRVNFQTVTTDEIILINGITYMVTKGQEMINQALGVKLDNSSISNSVLRLALNPLAFQFYTSTEIGKLRAFLFKTLIKSDGKQEYNENVSPKLQESLGHDLSLADIEKEISILKESEKILTNTKREFQTVSKYLERFHQHDKVKEFRGYILQATKALTEKRQKCWLYEQARKVVDARLTEKMENDIFAGIRFGEKLITKDDVKPALTPLVYGTDKPLSEGSTSERLITCVRFANQLRKNLELDFLPMLLDEISVLDLNSRAELIEIGKGRQVFYTNASTESEEGVKVYVR